MLRFVKVLVLWCLYSALGLTAVGLGTCALVAVGVDGLITPFLVLGLASVLPVSLAVADNVVPRTGRWVSPSVSCPHCGASFGLDASAKPVLDSWPFV
jgi:hypothetical protein